MIRLGTRLAAGGGRESLVRLLLTGAGLALAVTMLLFAAVAFPALHAHDVRRAWQQTNSTEIKQPAQDPSTTDPLLWRLTTDRFDGKDLVRVDVGPTGPDAPVPPGIERLPRPGEIAVSPALRRLLDTTDPALLADRFPGRIAATIGRDALASPDDLVVFVGRSPRELAAEPDVATVRSIESAPITHGLTQAMRFVLVIGGIGLLMPIVVFVVTATRLAAARREQRLAALRLAGATNAQVGWVAAVEAALAAFGGVAVGFGAFLAIRPWLARIPFDGATFYPSDLHLSLGWALLVGLGVPALAVGAAMVSLRRIRISPLGVARRATRSRPTARPLGLVAGGLLALVAVTLWARSSTAEEAEAYAAGAAFLVIIVGFVLSGPWLTAQVARGIARLGRGAPSLLAARRLQDNPAAGFRAISGITVAVFVGTMFAAMAASVISSEGSGSGLAANVVAAEPTFDQEALAPAGAGRSASSPGPGPAGPRPEPPPHRVVDPERVRDLEDDLHTIPGVRQVVTARALPDDPELLDSLVRSDLGIGSPVLVSCADAPALGFERCDGGATVLDLNGDDVESTGVTHSMSAGGVTDLPVVTLAAVTDGRATTVERVRTRLEAGLPGTHPITRRDIDAENNKELDTMQRISNIGLSVTLVIAGCSLAVAVAGAIVERRQAFALLRLAGTRLSDLRRVVLAEAATPLLMVALVSAALGVVVAYLVLVAGGAGRDFAMPGVTYWLALVGGLALALLVVMATLPLLSRLTALDSARFE